VPLLGLFLLAFVVLVLGGLFVRNLAEYRDTGALNAFTQTAVFLVMVGGALAWFGWFGNHGAFFAWPLLVVAVLAVLVVPRLFILERQKRERAEEERQFDDLPQHGGPASKGDFSDW